MTGGGGLDVRVAADCRLGTFEADDFDVDELYRLHYGRLRAHCARLLGDQAEAAVSIGRDGATFGTSVPAPGSGEPVPIEAWARRVEDGRDSAVMEVTDGGLDRACIAAPAPCRGLSLGEGGSS